MWLIGYLGKQILEDRPDDTTPDVTAARTQWPNCVVVKFDGGYGDLTRIGSEPTLADLKMTGGIDTRPYAMPAMTAGVLSGAIKAECSRRIYARVSAEEQVNMASALPDADKATGDTIRAVRKWVDAMRTASKALISAADAGYADDDKWPVWSDAWSATVALF